MIALLTDQRLTSLCTLDVAPYAALARAEVTRLADLVESADKAGDTAKAEASACLLNDAHNDLKTASAIAQLVEAVRKLRAAYAVA